MTGNGSTNALLVKAAVQAAMQADTGLTGVDIVWGPDPRDQPQEWILLGAIRWENEDWKTLKTKQEIFTLDLIVEVMETASSSFAVESHAASINASVEAFFKANPGLGLPYVVSSIYNPGRLLSFPADDRWVGQFHGELRVTARV
jgi:hypothetical protein